MDETTIVPLRPGIRPTGRSDGGQADGTQKPPQQIVFDRKELTVILNLYGRMVAAGEWRDYSFEWMKDSAAFCIYRRASEMPLYRIEKRPRLRARNGLYAVIAATGFNLKQGNELPVVLRVLEKKLRLVD